MSFFTPGELAGFRAMANDAMPDTGVISRPDYAGTAGPALIATERCRVVRFASAGGNLIDLTGEATHTIYMRHGAAAQEGDEVLVNGADRFAVTATDAGRSYPFALLVAAKRIA